MARSPSWPHREICGIALCTLIAATVRGLAGRIVDDMLDSHGRGIRLHVFVLDHETCCAELHCHRATLCGFFRAVALIANR